MGKENKFQVGSLYICPLLAEEMFIFETLAHLMECPPALSAINGFGATRGKFHKSLIIPDGGGRFNRQHKSSGENYCVVERGKVTQEIIQHARL